VGERARALIGRLSLPMFNRPHRSIGGAARMSRSHEVPLTRTYDALGVLAPAWDELALSAGSPFLTHEWLGRWWHAFGTGEHPIWVVCHDDDGSMRAGACLQRTRGNGLASAADELSGDWGVLARDAHARRDMWKSILGLGASRIHLDRVLEPASADTLGDALESSGYRAVRRAGPYSPWLALPGSWEEMLAGVSRKFRSEIRQRRRALERAGRANLRTSCGGPDLERDVQTFLRLEASGWKGRAGTSILGNADAEGLYLGFARDAAGKGWLRLDLLELDGEVIAASYGCAFAGVATMLKTCFDESHRRLAPGTVLAAEVVRRSIEEGLRACDFLGEREPYKERWTSEVRPREQIWAYRTEALPGYLYRSRLRPALKGARDLARARLPHNGAQAVRT
jgi:CelD/BcsL family acetyltransferase involved in cellulose biosynthesis